MKNQLFDDKGTANFLNTKITELKNAKYIKCNEQYYITVQNAIYG